MYWSTDLPIYWSTDQLIYWYTDQGQNVAWRIVRDTPCPGENSRYNTFKFSEAGTDEYHQDDFFEIPDAAKYTLWMAIFLLL